MDKKALSKRAKARIVLYLSAIILVLGIFSIVQTVKANKYERETMITRQMALISLDEYLNNISTNLEKTIYANTPAMLSKLSTEMWREASSAKNSLSMLPTGESSLDNTYKFLSQIGEFVMSLQRKTASGEELTASERNQLRQLYDYCNSLNEQVQKMCYDLENGNFSFESTNSTLLKRDDNISTISGSFDDVEQSISDLPSLIYDGPFSDHIEQGEAKYLKGLSEITKDKGLEIAKTVCSDSDLQYSSDENGNIPCYIFQSENCTVAITKLGGKPLYMLSSEYVGEISYKYEDALKNAVSYLKKIGYNELKESYYFIDDGVCTINFSAVQDDIVLYPDLIKVSVSLENGKVLSFDATGYISNHTERKIPENKISLVDARENVNDELTIIDSRVCIIPTEWKTEQYCYEFHCKASSGQELMVYIDSVTGQEDNILILLYSDNGVLTK